MEREKRGEVKMGNRCRECGTLDHEHDCIDYTDLLTAIKNALENLVKLKEIETNRVGCYKKSGE